MNRRHKRASVMFGWHKTFTSLAPWRKGKKDMPLESEVVLTKMKILTNNFQAEFVSPEESLANDSIAESDIPSESLEEPHSPPGQTQNTSGYLTPYSDLSTENSKCSRLSKLFKFESEDSGVELPSGANSPSTPTSSEQSFVVHSRGSSCDSGDLSTSPAVMDHIFLLSKCPEIEEIDNSVQQTVREKDMVESNELPSSENTPTDFTECQKTGGSFFNHSHENIVEETDKDVEEASRLEVPTEIHIDDTRRVSSGFREAFDDMTEGDLEEQRLQKYSTSDSLDEYMDECCRLSEVNQGKVKVLGSGLGYLEHICQLIEKIGQLQEHNLKLQKQICSLQKESRTKQMKEEYLLQCCSCGVASLAFQELKRHSIHRSEFHNPTPSNGTLSDLSTIPEISRRPDRLRKKGGFCCQDTSTLPFETCLPLHPSFRQTAGTDGQAEPGHNPLAPVLRRSQRSWVETARCDSEQALTSTLPQTQPMRGSENHHWGKVKDLVKKTKLRNQSRLGLSSNALKRSCPQLYRPDLGSADLPRRDRNSMITLGHNVKHDYLWPH
ncbi:uncharacterized protein LOC117416185 isoform X1 [Acipenser ruthenus]|uniref:uncharacterized protein LOC117416185 isoform X1 n=1 Tax=Acipenser ruthenus TaxID=7906 RepID=UPI00145B08A4|nr:uncharacterized protein LOC117416185 isoform X1 [Acipenser ruthenus]